MRMAVHYSINNRGDNLSNLRCGQVRIVVEVSKELKQIYNVEFTYFAPFHELKNKEQVLVILKCLDEAHNIGMVEL